MDRKHQEKLPAIQLSFIQHLVSPLYHSCAEAGIIPGIMENSNSPPSESPVPPITSQGGEEFIKTEGEGKREEGEARREREREGEGKGGRKGEGKGEREGREGGREREVRN